MLIPGLLWSILLLLIMYGAKSDGPDMARKGKGWGNSEAEASDPFICLSPEPD